MCSGALRTAAVLADLRSGPAHNCVQTLKFVFQRDMVASSMAAGAPYANALEMRINVNQLLEACTASIGVLQHTEQAPRLWMRTDGVPFAHGCRSGNVRRGARHLVLLLSFCRYPPASAGEPVLSRTQLQVEQNCKFCAHAA